MQLRVLGPLELVGDDATAVPLGGAQLRRALATLALHAPSSTPVDVLNDVLWPEGPPSSNALQATVSKLRKTIAPITIDATASAYSLTLGPAGIDAHHFEKLTSSGRDAAADGRHEAAVEQLDVALTMWRGRPFDDLADLPIGQAPAARLSSLRESAISTRLECNLSLGRLDVAAAELEALTVSEPFVERWWALLMLSRYRQNRQADALRAYQQARSILADELGLEPGPELRQLESRILQHDPSLGPASSGRLAQPVRVQPARTVTLPQRLMSFVGRDRHIESLSFLLAEERLITVLGPGGAGKTSLSIEVARRVAATMSPRVVLIELASVPRGGDVMAAVAAVVSPGNGELRSGAAPSNELDRIVDALGDQPLLLILDNCEHVVAEAAEFAAAVLRQAPSIRILATSREPLAVPGERIWPIPPLTADESFELLRARAASAGVELESSEPTRQAAARLIERLDGLPLAIELAAARLRSMSITDIVSRLDDRFALLSVGPRTAEPRQQTLRNLFDWSHDLLDEQERMLFRRLAVFPGGATLDAIEDVCTDPMTADDGPAGGGRGADRLLRRQAHELISHLVDKSLVLVDHTPAGARYRMLQTLADYAAEQLVAAGEAEAFASRHAQYFAERLRPVERGLFGHEQRHWMEWLRVEWANITAAIDHALAVDDGNTAICLTAPLGWYFFMIDESASGAEWLHAALSCGGNRDPRLHSLALSSYAFLASMGPDPAHAALVAERALATLDSYDDPITEAIVVGEYVVCHLFRGRIEVCRQALPLCEEAAHRSGDRWSMAMASLVGAEVLNGAGDPEAAEREMRHAADGFAAVGDRFSYTLCVTHAAELAEMHGDYDRAVRMLEESVAIAEDVGFSPRIMATRSRLANLEILRGNLALAASIHRRAIDVDDGPVPQWVNAISLLGLANIARRRGDPVEALRLVDEGIALPRSLGIPLMRSSLLVARGYSLDLAGERDAALAAQSEALTVALQLGTTRVVANAVEGLAGALAIDGQEVAAARLLGAADALRRRSGGPMPAAERFDVDRAERRARAALGDSAFEAEFAAGSEEPDVEIARAGHHSLRV